MDVKPRKGEKLPLSFRAKSDTAEVHFGSSGFEYNLRPMPFPNPFTPQEHAQYCSFHAEMIKDGTLKEHAVLTHRPHSFFTLTNDTVRNNLLQIITAGVNYVSPSAHDMMNVSMTLLADMAPLQRVCPGVTIQASGRVYAPINSHYFDPTRVREILTKATASASYHVDGIFFLARGQRSVWSENPYPDLSPEENRARLVSHLHTFRAQIEECKTGQEFLVRDWLAHFAETRFNCGYLDLHYDRVRVGSAKDNTLTATRARVRVQAGPIPKL